MLLLLQQHDFSSKDTVTVVRRNRYTDVIVVDDDNDCSVVLERALRHLVSLSSAKPKTPLRLASAFATAVSPI